MPADSHTTPCILSAQQIDLLRTALNDRLLNVCFGGGVDSTAMLVALHVAGIRVDLVSFADTGGEKPETLAHVDAMDAVLRAWGWLGVTTCRKVPLPSTGYADLYGNCLANETLPSLAFGMKSCSLKWKVGPQDQLLRGVASGPNARPPHPLWLEAKATGQRIVKLIGYDCGRADRRRAGSLSTGDSDFDYVYPLQMLGWERHDCIRAIAGLLGPAYIPQKSACFFCPASRPWELFWLAAHHPELLERALHLERTALTGKHSRFSTVEFGASWDDIVKDADKFPSSNTTVGLGRNFAWNQWARINGVVDDNFKVRRTAEDRERFLALSELNKAGGNALDARCERETGFAQSQIPKESDGKLRAA